MLRLVPAFALLLLAACAAHLSSPPALFPVALNWTRPFGEASEGLLASDRARIFVATRDDRVRALDATTGDVLWEAPHGGTLSLGAALLVVRGPDGTVWGLDPLTGKTRWQAGTGVPGTLPVLVDRERLIVAGTGVAALAPATGEVLWAATDGAESTAPPAAFEGRIYLGESDGTLRCRDGVSGRTVWIFKTERTLMAAPVFDDRQQVLLGTTDRRFLALDAKSGVLRWRWKIGADAQSQAVIVGSRVLFVTHEALLYALERGGGNLAWRTSLPSRPTSGPIVIGGTGVLVPCHGSRPQEGMLVGFDGRTGGRLGDMKTVAELKSPPLVVGDHLYLALRDRSVMGFALGVAPPSPSPSPSPTPAPSATPSPRASQSPAPAPAPSPAPSPKR